MAVTSEFQRAVRERNILRVRIMLKDSLLIDKTFKQFTEMQRCAEDNGAYFWMEVQNGLEKLPKEDWTMDVMNLELTKLVNDFSKERLFYCQEIVQYVYGVSTDLTQFSSQQLQQDTTRVSNSRPWGIDGSSVNHGDYAIISQNISDLNRELRKQKTHTGRKWTDKEIDKIYQLSKSVEKACERIMKRRK